MVVAIDKCGIVEECSQGVACSYRRNMLKPAAQVPSTGREFITTRGDTLRPALAELRLCRLSEICPRKNKRLDFITNMTWSLRLTQLQHGKSP